MRRSKAEAVLRVMAEEVRVCAIPTDWADPEDQDPPAECGARFFKYRLGTDANGVDPVVCPACYLKNHTRTQDPDPDLVEQLQRLIKHGT